MRALPTRPDLHAATSVLPNVGLLNAIVTVVLLTNVRDGFTPGWDSARCRGEETLSPCGHG